MKQSLSFGSVQMHSEHAEDRPYVLAGMRMLAIGMMSGAPPEIGDQGHLDGEMGGLWAGEHKVLDHWAVTAGVAFEAGDWHVVGEFWRITRSASRAGWQLQIEEWVDERDAVFHLEARLSNLTSKARRGNLQLFAQPNLRPCWMSHVAPADTQVFATKQGIEAVNAANPGLAMCLLADGLLKRSQTLAAGETQHMRIVVAAVNGGDRTLAHARAAAALSGWRNRMARKRATYVGLLKDTSQGAGPEGEINPLAAAELCARANLKLLETRNPAGHYPIAGLPEFPNLFGCDVAYSVPGLCMAGRADLALAALRALREVADWQCGRVPHEVLPDGGVFHPGNTQETPQFVIAVHALWQHGNATAIADEFVATCRAAMLGYLRNAFTWRASQFPDYPHGNAMVEREGMLPIKLDSVCYTWKALRCLLEMDGGRLSADDRNALIAWERAIRRRFTQDWWMPERGLFADSLGWDGTQQLDRHWTQVVPLEVGLATRAQARQVLDHIEGEWLTADGLPHTSGSEQRVWTLPTGLLALAAARHGRHDLARRQLANIACTLASGQLGLFEELIPRGLCFVQLWSAALFIQIHTEVTRKKASR